MTAVLTQPALKARNGKNPRAGHQMMAGTNNNKDKAWLDGVADTTLALFGSITVRYYWNELEGSGGPGVTSGTFDLSNIDRMLDYCAERKIFLKIMPMWRNFDTVLGDVMPADLVTNYQFLSSGGYNSAIYESTGTVRTRYEQLCKAIIDRYKDHPWFAALVTNETAGMENCTAEVYSIANYKTQLTALFTNLANYTSYVGLEFGWNFQKDAFTRAAADTAWSDTFTPVPNNSNVSLWTPDILGAGAPNFSALDERVYCFFNQAYASITHVINNFRIGSQMQFDSYTTSQNGGNDMDQLRVFGVDTLKVVVITWTYVNNRDYTFDSPRTGMTKGDAVGSADQAFDDPYNSSYAA